MKDAFLPSNYKFEAIGKGESHLTNVLKSILSVQQFWQY